jgi:acetyltransferase-like isoleucine patch superfamily enzyme
MEIPARSLVAGNPAKIVKTFEREQVSDAPYAFGPRR